MTRLFKSTVFFVILLYVVCDTASSFKIQWPTRKVHGIEFNNNDKDQSLFLLGQLINSYKHHQHHKDVHLFQPSTHENLISETETVFDIQHNTSCGKLTCDHVEDYPEKQIEKIYTEKFKNKKTVTTEFNPVVVMRKGFMPLEMAMLRSASRARSYELPKSESMISCSQMVEETFPKEALNESNQPTIIVRLPKERIGPKGLECKAPKHCKDPRTPEYRVWICTTKTKWMKALTYNKKTNDLEEQTVQITDGCSCEETNKPVKH